MSISVFIGSPVSRCRKAQCFIITGPGQVQRELVSLHDPQEGSVFGGVLSLFLTLFVSKISTCQNVNFFFFSLDDWLLQIWVGTIWLQYLWKKAHWETFAKCGYYSPGFYLDSFPGTAEMEP